MIQARTISLGVRYYAYLTQESGMSVGGEAPYPGWYKKYIPVMIEGEHTKYYVCKVLPHMDAYGGITPPYNVTIDKWHIEQGIFKIFEIDK